MKVKKIIFMLLLVIVLINFSNNSVYVAYNKPKLLPSGTIFKDDNFYKCVVDNYNSATGDKADYNTVLSDDQLSKITDLECNKKKIVDVTGIEKMVNLVILNLSNNNIKNIDLSINKSLREIQLYNNYLKKIDGLSELKNIEFLSVFNNQLELSEWKNCNNFCKKIDSCMCGKKVLQFYNSNNQLLISLNALINPSLQSNSFYNYNIFNFLPQIDSNQKWYAKINNNYELFSPNFDMIQNYTEDIIKVYQRNRNGVDWIGCDKKLNIKYVCDENGDNIINIADAKGILKFVLGLNTDLEAFTEGYYAYDANVDGKIDTGDVVAVIKYYLSKQSQPKPENNDGNNENLDNKCQNDNIYHGNAMTCYTHDLKDLKKEITDLYKNKKISNRMGIISTDSKGRIIYKLSVQDELANYIKTDLYVIATKAKKNLKYNSKDGLYYARPREGDQLLNGMTAKQWDKWNQEIITVVPYGIHGTVMKISYTGNSSILPPSPFYAIRFDAMCARPACYDQKSEWYDIDVAFKDGSEISDKKTNFNIQVIRTGLTGSINTSCVN